MIKPPKIALVTGALQGIGQAICHRLVSSGYYVYASDAQEKILELSPTTSIAYLHMDVTDQSSIDAAYHLMQQAEHSLPYVLVNNAGIFAMETFLNATVDTFKHILDVNLIGVFRVSQTFVKGMMNLGGGRIINIASISALNGTAQMGQYAASKAGLIALTKTMALELARYNIQVNTILPGYVDTAMSHGHAQFLDLVAKMRIPQKRLAKTEEIAELVGFLANSELTYMTGSEIIIDGGLRIS